MQLERVVCNSCGAPLQVPQSAKHVTCTHCDSQLVVRRTEGARFTEVVEDLRDQVAKLTRQNEIEALDRQWDRERQRFLVTNKHGYTHVPTRAAAVGGGLFAAGFGLFWMVFTYSITSKFPFGVATVFPLFGLVFVAVGLGIAVYGPKKAAEYERAQREYHWRRRELEESEE